jgi:hypothetical protein
MHDYMNKCLQCVSDASALKVIPNPFIGYTVHSNYCDWLSTKVTLSESIIRNSSAGKEA